MEKETLINVVEPGSSPTNENCLFLQFHNPGWSEEGIRLESHLTVLKANFDSWLTTADSC